jgi:hypothetical protein
LVPGWRNKGKKMNAEKMVGRVIAAIRLGESVFGGGTAALTSDAKSDSAYEFVVVLDDGSEWALTGKHDEDVVIRQRKLITE